MVDVAAPGHWLDEAQRRVAGATLGARVEDIGTVRSVADGIAMVSGLARIRLDELVHFERGQTGFVHALEPDVVACVLLDDAAGVQAGDHVRGSGDVVRVPVGEGLLGRVVDPLGRALDGDAPIEASALHPIEREAPAIVERELVTEPVQTGTLVVDTLFALGRGQRELIIGDRAIGKTTLAVDAIINQRETDIVCVYVAVGQKTAAVRRAIDAVQRHGNPARCIFVVAPAAGAPGIQWIAPFAGFTMAEYFRDRGGHALVVVDDLTKHAASHREIALLTRQSPGREAYPGDVFYVHARLLERAARLSAARGGGSLTALPIAETDAGNLSAYIPTNLISITDGQIALDARLFHEGVKPAVDVGISVSRVGGKTQAAALRDAAQSLRLDYAQFLELEMFTRFGGMPDARVRAQLARGQRIRDLFAQPQHAPLPLAVQVALVIAVQEGMLDAASAQDVQGMRDALAQRLPTLAPLACEDIGRDGRLGDEGGAQLRAALRGLLPAAGAAHE